MLSFRIALRYLVSKKSANAINIMSAITSVAMGVGAMALILVLSVFNGFEGLVISLYDSFYSDVKITSTIGKTFELNEQKFKQIKGIEGVEFVSRIVEENGIVVYNDKQHIATIKGVEQSFFQIHDEFLDKNIIEGNRLLEKDSLQYSMVGIGIAQYLGINVNNYFTGLWVHIPNRKSSGSSLEGATMSDRIYAGSLFAVQQEFNNKYVIVPISFIRNLMQFDNQTFSALEISVTNKKMVKKVKAELTALMGEGFEIEDRLEQNDALYKVMKTEKWVVFAILTFILIIASFNIIGSLSMLILEKRVDIATLISLGARPKLIERIFLAEGLLLSLSGATIGIVLAVGIALLQQHVGIVKIPGNTFVVSYYPVKVMLIDIIAVTGAVVLISLAASYLPAMKAARKQNIIEQIKGL
jgi:lipoprotein-releasing system permease protein